MKRDATVNTFFLSHALGYEKKRFLNNLENPSLSVLSLCALPIAGHFPFPLAARPAVEESRSAEWSNGRSREKGPGERDRYWW